MIHSSIGVNDKIRMQTFLDRLQKNMAGIPYRSRIHLPPARITTNNPLQDVSRMQVYIRRKPQLSVYFVDAALKIWIFHS